MSKINRNKGGGAKKIGRSIEKCTRYKTRKTREKNKLKKLLKQRQVPTVKLRVKQLQDYITGITSCDGGRKIVK